MRSVVVDRGPASLPSPAGTVALKPGFRMLAPGRMAVPGTKLPLARFPWPGLAGVRLGQDLSELSDPSDLLDGVESLLDQIPSDDPVWGKYKSELDRCLKLLSDGGLISLYLAGKCLYDLYKDVKAYVKALREQEEAKKQAPPPPPVTQPQAEFPWLYVALAAAAGIGIAVAVK